MSSSGRSVDAEPQEGGGILERTPQHAVLPPRGSPAAPHAARRAGTDGGALMSQFRRCRQPTRLALRRSSLAPRERSVRSLAFAPRAGARRRAPGGARSGTGPAGAPPPRVAAGDAVVVAPFVTRACPPPTGRSPAVKNSCTTATARPSYCARDEQERLLTNRGGPVSRLPPQPRKGIDPPRRATLQDRLAGATRRCTEAVRRRLSATRDITPLPAERRDGPPRDTKPAREAPP
jgi:hypothetical protein